jgi:hypothetical protein
MLAKYISDKQQGRFWDYAWSHPVLTHSYQCVKRKCPWVNTLVDLCSVLLLALATTIIMCLLPSEQAIFFFIYTNLVVDWAIILSSWCLARCSSGRPKSYFDGHQEVFAQLLIQSQLDGACKKKIKNQDGKFKHMDVCAFKKGCSITCMMDNSFSSNLMLHSKSREFALHDNELLVMGESFPTIPVCEAMNCFTTPCVLQF